METLCECGGTEFITEPNAYDVYQYTDGTLSFIRSMPTDDTFKLYCRECGTEVTPQLDEAITQ